MSLGKSYVVIGDDDFSAMLAERLGAKHVRCHCGHYPHEDLYRIEGVEYEELRGKHAILVTRFGQPYAEKDPSKLSNLTLGMIAFVYDLFRTTRCLAATLCSPAWSPTKQDHIPPRIRTPM